MGGFNYPCSGALVILHDGVKGTSFVTLSPASDPVYRIEQPSRDGHPIRYTGQIAGRCLRLRITYGGAESNLAVTTCL